MPVRLGGSKNGSSHALLAAVAFGCLGLLSVPASAALIEPNFFDSIPDVSSGQAGVEADYLTYDANSTQITASGAVAVSYLGYAASADRLTFNRTTRELHLWGNVKIVDPNGVQYTADDAAVTGGFRNAILKQLVLVTPDGAMITADSAEKVRDVSTTLINASYSPCGTCIDAKGRRIGWRVRADKFVQNTETGFVEADHPVLELLGYPVAWLPWLSLPDPSDPNRTGFRLPSVGYGQNIGVKLSVPYYIASGRDMGILLTPSLISGQGLLMGAEFDHSLGDRGAYSVALNGIYQFNPGAFPAGFGDTNWRGSLQTEGTFTPTDNWTAGWSYTAFSDRTFLKDYLIDDADVQTNQVYGTYLDANTFADARVQEFALMGQKTQADQNKQALAVPNAKFDHLQDLGDAGRVRISGSLLGVMRAADDQRSNAINYDLGYQGTKVRGTAEAMWSRESIVGSAAVTPYLGLRLDAADYDGASALDPMATSLLAATPIAAVDVRMPFMAQEGRSTHLIEPIAQVVYRGSNTTLTGIHNDDAQSFVLDDTNIFSFNRFSGDDRQETGLRANIGAHYLARFDKGTYLDFVAGQSFHLAGVNGLATADTANAGAGAGMDGMQTNIVAGVNGSVRSLVKYAAKVSVDPMSPTVDRFSGRVGFTPGDWAFGADYSYLGADPARGFNTSQQDVGAYVSVPLADYWTGKASVGWDLTGNALVNYGLDVLYDDGYLEYGANLRSTGAMVFNPDSFAVGLTLKLKGPDGKPYGE